MRTTRVHAHNTCKLSSDCAYIFAGDTNIINESEELHVKNLIDNAGDDVVNTNAGSGGSASSSGGGGGKRVLDMWRQLKPNEEGFTYDSQRNKSITYMSAR